MLQEKKRNANIGVGLGVIIQVSYIFLHRGGYFGPIEFFGDIIELLGLFTFTWGCMNYAEGKGHSKWLGLLGLLCCVGLCVLVFLPDRNKDIK
jgi:hypothetical protein